MGVLELHPRNTTTTQGGLPSAERRFLETPYSAGGDTVPSLGAGHPEFASLKAVEISKETGYGGDPSQTLTVVRYSADGATCENDPDPLQRCARWSFSTGGVSVPAFSWLDNGTRKPLVNSAGDLITGHQVQQLEVRAVKTYNLASFPLSGAAYLTNKVNNSTFLGGNARSWLCAGIRATQKTELVNGVSVHYYECQAELVYNDGLWVLYVPDVGIHYLNNGVKKRCYVEDEDGNYVPTSGPVALNPNGSMGSQVQFLARPVYGEVNFAAEFGTP